MRFSRVWIALLCACGPGLNDLKIEGGPVARIRAKVDVQGIRATGYEGDLLVGFLWATAGEVPPACSTYADVPEITAHCNQTFSVKIRQSVPMTPLQADANGIVELALETLPDATVSSGNARGRVSYGSIVVAADVDANGIFEPWGAMNSGGQSTDEWVEPDRVVAASFSSLREPQQRIVLREGAWNPLSLFFPTIGCDAPPVGFSRLVATLDLSGSEPSAECEIKGIDTVFDVPVLSPNASDEMRCSSWINVSNPEQYYWDENSTAECVNENLLFQPGDGPCMSPNVVPLSGCWDGRGPCDTPDWDLTDNPPDWWPCK